VQLRTERILLDQAIANLERLTEHPKRPRGRPRKAPYVQSAGPVPAATAGGRIESVPN